MSGPLRCRVPVTGPDILAVDCGKPAAVGLVIASVDITRRDILELAPLCADHAPEAVNELSATGNPADWTVVTLAYGGSGGDLR